MNSDDLERMAGAFVNVASAALGKVLDDEDSKAEKEAKRENTPVSIRDAMVLVLGGSSMRGVEVHDELVFEVPKRRAAEEAERLGHRHFG
jgi:hypothetical protein